ncbi:hypothetical protein Tco_0491198 [Tanacetum coccineum]
MGDEHLSTIPETESDEVIKSSVENLVPIPITMILRLFILLRSNPYLEEFTAIVELAHIAPNSTQELLKLIFDPNDYNIELMTIFEFGAPDQGGLTSVVISNHSNDPLLELPEFESFHFDPSFLRPPPEPLDICLDFKPDTVMKNNEDFNQREIVLSLNVKDVQ